MFIDLRGHTLAELTAAADALHEQLIAAEPAALTRLRQHHPHWRDGEGDRELDPSDARLVVAREHGASFWSRLVEVAELLVAAAEVRAAALVRAACSEELWRARALLAHDPGLVRHDLITAAVCGDAEHALALLQSDPRLACEVAGPDGREPILYACFSRFLRVEPERASAIVAVVRALVDAGADVNAAYLEAGEQDPDHRQTPLYAAAGIANDVELTELLIAAGADPNDRVSEACLGPEVLYHACEFEDIACLERVVRAGAAERPMSYCVGRALDFDNTAAVRLLLEAGADPNLRLEGQSDFSLLHGAIGNGCGVETITALIEHGADLTREAGGRSAYRRAVRHGLEEAARCLAAAGAPTADVDGRDLLLGACMGGDIDRSAALVSEVGPLPAEDAVMLEAAAGRGLDAAIPALLAAGVDPAGDHGGRALHAACWFGHRAAVAQLVHAGAPLEWVSEHGGTPVGTAVYASQHCKDPRGGPTMRLAEECHHGDYPGIVRTLVTAGARVPRTLYGSDAVIDELLRLGLAETSPEEAPQG